MPSEFKKIKLRRLKLPKAKSLAKMSGRRIAPAASEPNTAIKDAPKTLDRATVAALSKPIFSAKRPPTPQKPEATPISQLRAQIKLKDPNVQMPMLASSTLEERIARSRNAKLLLPNRTRPARKLLQRSNDPLSPLGKAKRARKRVALSEALKNLSALNADVRDLQEIIGLQGLALAKPEVTFVSLDLEWLPMMHRDRITEIGVTTLKAKDIIGLEPGAFAENWHAKMRHEHAVIPGARSVTKSYFGKTCLMNFDQAKSWLRNLLAELSATGPVAMVGQSVDGDIAMLASSLEFKLQLKDIIGSGYKIFDTHLFGLRSTDLGSKMYPLRLGSLANHLGVPHKYRLPASAGHGVKRMVPSFIGAHNASNDAAISMMCLLLFALRWNEISSAGQNVLNYDWHNTGFVRNWDAVPVAETEEGWQRNEDLMRTSGTPWMVPSIEETTAREQQQEDSDHSGAQHGHSVQATEPTWLRRDRNKHRRLKLRRERDRRRIAGSRDWGRIGWKWPSIAVGLVAGGILVTSKFLAG